ncbi:hypothetical protein PP175_28125 (plasmid) [Aneurinibacillus sp. Ricciae_BoGa-3]|uniref:hypothetical protein n=1 Tax=Aneurinibacillus sp. Ricciae_BoGa-3 TaxID=3022697 RepID=UPI00234004EA|nr:hypothetical protein [Aneurinibacillus sp. Ricciae_BoGa-3]WCK57058.1 hypothetical protein PP175_28125 [Aneurinibacillus sp. Ricciae_BoGa-3]
MAIKRKRLLKKWANIVVDSELTYRGRRYWLKGNQHFVTYQDGCYYIDTTPVLRTVARDTILHRYYGVKRVKHSYFS